MRPRSEKKHTVYRLLVFGITIFTLSYCQFTRKLLDYSGLLLYCQPGHGPDHLWLRDVMVSRFGSVIIMSHKKHKISFNGCLYNKCNEPAN